MEVLTTCAEKYGEGSLCSKKSDPSGSRARTPLQMLLTVTLAILAPTAKLTLFTIYIGAALSQGAIASYGSYIIGKSTQVYLQQGLGSFGCKYSYPGYPHPNRT